MQSLQNLIEDIKTIISSVEIKYEAEGKRFDSIDTYKMAQSYISAKTKVDSFSTYYKFDPQAIVNAGITDANVIASILQDKYNTPTNKRDLLATEQRKLIVDNYIEYNNYYRNLWGLPDNKDLNHFYVSSSIASTYGIDANTPIHELPSVDIYALEAIGYLDTLRADNPTKTYLRFLGDSKIDPSISRPAKNFTILKVNRSVEYSTLLSNFLGIYEACREYFMSVIYIPEFAINYTYYDNFIGMLIMVMALQRFFADMFRNGIKRDFFDIEMIRDFFDSYKVPFFENLPYEYQINIIKNINKLLQYKSTDKVLFDLAQLIDFPDLSIFEYFLIKEHKLDIDGKPQFFYKDVDDGDGGTVSVLDKELMYNFYFQRVSLKEKNLAGALLDSANKVDYTEVTLDDPFWFEDDDLKNKLYEEEFAFAESKYMGLNIIYRIPKMLFEINYFYRLVIDKRTQLSTANVTLLLPKITADDDVKLFDVVILLATLICKRNGLTGNIFVQPSQILTVYGFDFNEDFATIRQFVSDNPTLVDPAIADYFSNLNALIPEDVNRLYANIRDFKNFAIERMALSTDLKEYRAYQKLFTSLMVCEENEETFRKSDETVATTYLEFLQDINPTLYDFVANIQTGDISTYILHIINRLQKLVTELQYLHIVNNDGNIFLDALTSLILFFKSYTVDLLGNSIIFLFDSRYYNMVKLIDTYSATKDISVSSDINLAYSDVISSVQHFINHKDKMAFRDTIKISYEIVP